MDFIEIWNRVKVLTIVNHVLAKMSAERPWVNKASQVTSSKYTQLPKLGTNVRIFACGKFGYFPNISGVSRSMLCDKVVQNKYISGQNIFVIKKGENLKL